MLLLQSQLVCVLEWSEGVVGDGLVGEWLDQVCVCVCVRVRVRVCHVHV